MLQNNDDPNRLFSGEPEAFLVTAHYVIGWGWTMKISVRRQFQSWSQAAQGRYECLSTQEMEDVLLASLEAELPDQPADDHRPSRRR